MENEEILFKLIDKVDNESYKLFSEIVDLKVDSLYKVENIFLRLKKLTCIYEDLCKAYECFENKEDSKLINSTIKFRLKELLTVITTIYAFTTNPLLGIGSFVLLNTKASSDFVKDIKATEDVYSKFDQEKIDRIGITLENSARILNGKTDKMNEKFYTFHQANELERSRELYDCVLIVVANDCIRAYVNGVVPKEEMSKEPEIIKHIIIDILKAELKSNSNNLYELLDMAKIDYEESKKIELEYNKTKKLFS